MAINKTNWNDFVKQIIPWFYRTQVHVDWWKALIKPLVTLHNKWFDYYNNTIYRLNHTAQTIYLEKFLNDKHDPNQRRIYIEDISGVTTYLFNDFEVGQEIYLYNDSESSQEYYIYNYVDTSKGDFDVNVPSNIDQNVIYGDDNYTITQINNLIKADVNRFVFAGLIFNIKNV